MSHKCAAFDDAYASFVQSLPAADRHVYAPCASADDVLEGLRQLDLLSKQRQRTRTNRLLGGVKKLSDRLQTYFGVVDTFIQADSQYSAIVWGALKLICVLANQYVSFFEKLVSMLERLADVLPTLGRIPPCTASSGPIKRLLEKIYTDVLEIFQRSARIFTSSHGRIRNTPAIISNVLWTPFDVRFKDILDGLRSTRETLFDEILLVQANRAHNAELRAERERHRAQVERDEASIARSKLNEVGNASSAALAILQHQVHEDCKTRLSSWLSAPQYATPLHQSEAIKEDGTNEWIFSEPVYSQWYEQDWVVRVSPSRRILGPNVLWVHGNPGAGKTVLTSSIIRYVSDSAQQQEVILYYFFQAASVPHNSTVSAWKSMLQQVVELPNLDSSTTMLDLMLLILSDKKASEAESVYFDLFRRCLQQLDRVILVLDGIDECDDNSHLIARLRSLTAETAVKVMLLSRPNVVALQRQREKASSLELHRLRVSQDIEIYAERQMQELADEELLPSGEDIQELVRHICKGADGMFLWAVLMCKYLRSPALTPARRSRTLREVVLPEGLDGVYRRILSLISVAGNAEQLVARQVMLWLPYVGHKLDTVLIEQAALQLQDDDPEDQTQRFEDFPATVTIACGGLVEANTAAFGGNGRGWLSFIHLSIEEFFEQTRARESSLDLAFPTLLWPSHLRAVQLSCQFLTCICRTSSKMPQEAHIRRGHGTLGSRLAGFPLLTYSCFQWPVSLAQMHVHEAALLSADDSVEIHNLVTALEAFLGSPLAVSLWLQVTYTMKTHDGNENRSTADQRRVALAGLGLWADWAQNLPQSSFTTSISAIAKKVASFTSDIERFVDEWGVNLIDDPSFVFDDMASLSRSAFLFRPTTQNVHVLKARRPSVGSTSSQALCTSSATDNEGTHSVVLTIWPNQEFEAHMSAWNPQKPYRELERLCVGWRARIEIWKTTGSPRKIATLDITLDEHEVALQLRQSFRGEMGAKWKTSFPHSIHADSKSVVILRTVYRLQQDKRIASARWQSSIIPLDFTSTLASKWSAELEAFDPSSERLSKVPPGLHFIFRECYRYLIRFSPEGDKIFFADYHSSGENHAVMFATPLGDDLCVTRTASQVFENNYNSWFQFDKDPPIDVAFCSAERVIFCFTRSIWIWNYLRNEKPHRLHQDLNAVSGLNISACGNYVVAATANGPIVVDISKTKEEFLKAPDGTTIASDRTRSVTQRESNDIIESGPLRHFLLNDLPKEEASTHRESVAPSKLRSFPKGLVHLFEHSDATTSIERSMPCLPDMTIASKDCPEKRDLLSAAGQMPQHSPISISVARSHGVGNAVAIQRHNAQEEGGKTVETWNLFPVPERLSDSTTAVQIKEHDGNFRVFVNKRLRPGYSFADLPAAADSAFIVDRSRADIVYTRRPAATNGYSARIACPSLTLRDEESHTVRDADAERDDNLVKRIKLDV